MLEIPPPRATRDYLPEEAAERREVLDQFAHTAGLYGYRPVETPSFEKVELFSARSGPEIKSQLLVFHADHEEFALRPELTAPVCRLAASGALEDEPAPHRFFYTGSCFRYCRPGSGLLREFTQAGLELLNEPGPSAEAEIIAAATRFLRSVGVGDFTLRIGTVGVYRDLLPEKIDAEDRSTILGHLDRLASIREMCAQLATSGDKQLFDELNIDRKDVVIMQQRSEYEGPYAVADAQELDATALAERLPLEAEAAMRDTWSKEDYVADDVAEKLIAVSRLRGSLDEVVEQARGVLEGTRADGALANLLAVCDAVESYGVKNFEVVLGIARGLTFYSGAVFEICAPAAQGGKKYGGGGRYDGLIELFGGESTPAVGCAFRFDTLLDAVAANGGRQGRKAFDLFLEADGDGLSAARAAAETLRDRGVRTGVGPNAPADHTLRVGKLDGSGNVVIAGKSLSLDEVSQ